MSEKELMEDGIFNQFRELIHEASGIALGKEKKPLLQNRVQRRLRELKLSSLDQYFSLIQADLTGKELILLLDAISTNVTHFYRESAHFDHLAEILKQWSTEGRRRLKIWCAASSSGEEPYTIAINVKEHFTQSGAESKILATDISTRILERARSGIYPEGQFRYMPERIRKSYFAPIESTGEPLFQVTPKLQEIVMFKRLNLAQFPYPLKGPIDIIFCRNVMIYFDVVLRRKIIAEFERLLSPGGYLFLSRSETLLGVDHKLTNRAVSVYQK